MFTRLKVPKDEEKERQEQARIDRLIESAIHLFEAAVVRHDAAMEAGHDDQADSFSETAAYWFGAITGRTG